MRTQTTMDLATNDGDQNLSENKPAQIQIQKSGISESARLKRQNAWSDENVKCSQHVENHMAAFFFSKGRE